jgi:hypothetical protein
MQKMQRLLVTETRPAELLREACFQQQNNENNQQHNADRMKQQKTMHDFKSDQIRSYMEHEEFFLPPEQSFQPYTLQLKIGKATGGTVRESPR